MNGACPRDGERFPGAKHICPSSPEFNCRCCIDCTYECTLAAVVVANAIANPPAQRFTIAIFHEDGTPGLVEPEMLVYP